MRKALVDKGQAPHAAIIGCADSRAPVETLFDAAPGDLFVLRNAGNTCTHAEGSFLGSLEFCVGKLGSRLIVVMGHTNCGALAGAAGTYLSIKEAAETKTPGCALEGLLQGLTSVAAQTAQELGGTPAAGEIASAAVKVNVFNTINFLLKFSEPIRKWSQKLERLKCVTRSKTWWDAIETQMGELRCLRLGQLKALIDEVVLDAALALPLPFPLPLPLPWSRTNGTGALANLIMSATTGGCCSFAP
ncbi:cynT [Symbiodinium sp. CCMP2592]|nr:cynT [Symbiodinium sp. CCMP2592]